MQHAFGRKGLEHDMLQMMRIRAENDRRNDAAKRIQRFIKTKRANKIFKTIVSNGC
jgi:hypothetical protein